MLTKIWQYNPVTGYWQYVRDCDKAYAANWLAIFRSDAPGQVFKASMRRPVKAPAAAPSTYAKAAILG